RMASPSWRRASCSSPPGTTASAASTASARVTAGAGAGRRPRIAKDARNASGLRTVRAEPVIPAAGFVYERDAMAGTGVLSAILLSGDRHAFDEDRSGLHVAAAVDVAADGDDAAVHLLQVPGDGDLLDGMADLAVLHPEAGRAARVVPRHAVDAEADEI